MPEEIRMVFDRHSDCKLFIVDFQIVELFYQHESQYKVSPMASGSLYYAPYLNVWTNVSSTHFLHFLSCAISSFLRPVSFSLNIRKYLFDISSLDLPSASKDVMRGQQAAVSNKPGTEGTRYFKGLLTMHILCHNTGKKV